MARKASQGSNSSNRSIHHAGEARGFDLEETQTQMIESICLALEAEAGALMLRVENHPDLVIRKTSILGCDWIQPVDLKTGDSLVKKCLRSGQVFCVNDISTDRRFNANFDALPGIEVRSILCVPVVEDGQIIGAIELFNKRSGSFDTRDQEVLAMIASLVAQALYRAALVRQLKTANAELETSRLELLRSRNTLRALFDSIPAALYIIDRSYKLVAINLSCAQRTGQMPKKLVGRQCYEAIYGYSEVCQGCRVGETFQDGSCTVRSERRWLGDAEPSEWEISTYPIIDPGVSADVGQVSQAILLEQEVTEKRRLESIISQSEKLAAVGQLAAGVAHEINNPLTAIIANAQILQRDLPPSSELQESADLIARAGARAAQVVRNLLDFTRKEHIHVALTDVNDTIKKSLALVQHELLARSIQLAFDPDLNLPSILASQDQLQGLWLNLLLNALDAIENKSGKITITTQVVGEEIRVSVADNGKGIPQENLGHIFEPFFTTKAPGRGTGLGLSVCHRIVKQHRGYILVNSQAGAGTEFIVALPIS